MLTLLPTACLLFDNTAASREGWALFECGPDPESRPQIQLQREDAPEDREPPFASDRDAWEHVAAHARTGSALHRAALAVVDDTERRVDFLMRQAMLRLAAAQVMAEAGAMGNTMYGSLEDLLDDCPIEALARKLTVLKRAGRNKMMGCCPFHAEGTASFCIGPLDKPRREQRFWCHGCGVQGDAVDLMAHAEGATREKVLTERVRSAADAPEHEAGEDIGF